MTSNYAFLLDSMIVVLLIATIVYAVILNKRLQGLRNNRAELEQAARAFAESAIRADESIKSLKSASDGAGSDLREQIHRAQALRDEMKFLVEAGEALADRLEVGAAGAVDGRRDAKPRDRSSVRGSTPAGGPGNGATRRADAARHSDAEVTPLRARPEKTAVSAPDQSEKTGRARGRGDVDLLKAIENMR